MIIQVGLLFAAYVGSKVYESSKLKKAQLIKIKEQFEQQERGRAKGNKTHFQEIETPDVVESKEEEEKLHARYLKTTAASMGLFAFKGLIPGAVPLGLAAYLYSVVPYMKNVEKSLIHDKKVNVDVLFFVADALTLGVRNYFTAAFGLYLIYSGKFMVAKAKDESSQMVVDLFKDLPQTVWVYIDGVEMEIPISKVKADDLLLVNSGGVIPVDGVIHKGVAQVDQHALTGEAQPAEKVEGDQVFANTIVLAGKILIRVTRSGADTTSAQIADMLYHSVSFKSGVQLKGERWANLITLPMLIGSIVTLPIIGPASTAVFINSHIGVRIQLYAPLTTLRHIREASNLGVLVKDGRALEHLCDVDTILFDKTGTLTTGHPEVKKVFARNGYTENEILTFAATAERKLEHPIARAILTKAKEEEIELDDIQDSNYKFGLGISVSINMKLIRVGSVRFFRQEGITIPQDLLDEQEKSHALGNTFIFVGIDQEVGGSLELQPQIRSEIPEMIAQLRSFGIDHMAIVSGDHQTPTRKLAEELGMDEYFYNVLPENKAQIVEKLQSNGRVVCFIGDGINDSIALKKANVAMSIAGASSIAKDMAEIIFMDGSLNHLVEMVELSKRLDVNLKRSLALCLIPGVANFTGAFFLNFSILTSLLINNGVGAVGISSIFYSRKKVIPKIIKALPEKKSPVDMTASVLQISSDYAVEVKVEEVVED